MSKWRREISENKNAPAPKLDKVITPIVKNDMDDDELVLDDNLVLDDDMDDEMDEDKG